MILDELNVLNNFEVKAGLDGSIEKHILAMI